MIIAIIYIFLTYVIYDQQLKETFRKSSGPLKNPLPLFTHLHLEIKKIFPFGQHLKFFRAPGRKGGGHCVPTNKIMI